MDYRVTNTPLWVRKILAQILLTGIDGIDYLLHERDAEEWELWAWIHRN